MDILDHALNALLRWPIHLNAAKRQPRRFAMIEAALEEQVSPSMPTSRLQEARSILDTGSLVRHDLESLARPTRFERVTFAFGG
jgi:hypothetical protein